MLDALRAHGRGGRILAGTLDVSVGRRVSRSGEGLEEGILAGRAATIIRPRSRPPWPAVLFANGATSDGRAHPIVRRLGLALAGSGYLVFIPELPGIAGGELGPETVAAAVACAGEAAGSGAARAGRIGLIGVSVGGALALLTAAAADIAPHVSVVACIAPFTDLEKVMMLATTGTYPGPRGPESHPVPPLLAAGLARSLVALGSPVPATAALLANRDPSRFAGLFAALPEEVRSVVASLSPVRSAGGLLAPVEIATAPRDAYFPVAESRALEHVARDVRVTVTSALAHATPRVGFASLAGLVRLHGFFARSLAAAGRQRAS